MRVDDPLIYTQSTVSWAYLKNSLADENDETDREFTWTDITLMQNHVQRNNDMLQFFDWSGEKEWKFLSIDNLVDKRITKVAETEEILYGMML